MENEFNAEQAGSGFLNGDRENKTVKIIERRQLENGMELILYDCSRIMTGDRWIIEIQCKAFIPLEESYWETVTDEDPRHRPAIRKMLGEKLVFASSKKRTFVATKEKEEILREMVQQVYDSILKYLDRSDFPRRLFEKQYRDARQKVLIRVAMSQAERSQLE